VIAGREGYLQSLVRSPEESVRARRAFYYRRAGLHAHAPNLLQRVRLSDIAPSPQNVRLFNPAEGTLDAMTALYRAARTDPRVILPDAPVVRWHGEGEMFELLSGHRRVLAATSAGCDTLPVRVVTATDEEAFRFIRAANDFEALTTIEQAYAVAEMQRLGFVYSDLRLIVGAVGLDRYARVGQAVNPAWFTDVPKRANPSITLWGYALKAGPQHFQECFRQWDAGTWDDADCAQHFRRRGRTGGGESYESGIRLSVDEGGRRLRFRGTIDLDMLTPEEIERDVARPFLTDLMAALSHGRLLGGFGAKRVTRFLPADPTGEEEES
jgi:hypothetical protein